MAKKKAQYSIPGVGRIYQKAYTYKGERKTSPTWYIRWADRTEQSTGTEDQAQAYDMLVRLAGARASGQLATRRGTIGELLDLVIADGKRRKSFTDKRQRVGVLREKLGTIPINEFRRKDAESFCESLECSDTTKNRYMAELHRAFRLGTEEEPPLCVRVPKLPRFKESAPRQGILPREKYMAMRDALIDPQARLFFVLAYHTGMRSQEVLSLRWDQIRDGMIWLEDSKNSEPRVVPLYGDMLAHVTAAERSGKRVFSVNYWGMRKAWNAARIAAGLPTLNPHDLRRTALTNMIAAGIPQHEAMRISGHKSQTVFERYLITGENTARRVGERMAGWLVELDAEPKRKPS